MDALLLAAIPAKGNQGNGVFAAHHGPGRIAFGKDRLKVFINNLGKGNKKFRLFFFQKQLYQGIASFY
jgi:hypothetical protein